MAKQATSFIIVLCGVSGSGKSVVGHAVSTLLACPFLEADELHDASSVAKMRQGEALTEDDRLPWLARIRRWIDEQLALGGGGVVACSALTRAARALLRREGVIFVLLRVPVTVLATRVRTREHAFMPPELLPSQLDTFEEPLASEGVRSVDSTSDVLATARAVARLVRDV